MKKQALLVLALVLLTGCQQFREWWAAGGGESTQKTLETGAQLAGAFPGFGPAVAAILTLVAQGLSLISPAEDDE